MQVSANLVEPGDDVLVCNSGYFGSAFADCLEAYSAKVTQLRAPVGDAVSAADVISALKEKSYKMVTITHVDTSTGIVDCADFVAFQRLKHVRRCSRRHSRRSSRCAGALT